jgi:hypothetical protein
MAPLAGGLQFGGHMLKQTVKVFCLLSVLGLVALPAIEINGFRTQILIRGQR